MTAPAPPVPELDNLDRDITLALAALRRARLARSRSDDLDTARTEENAEWRLNRLLDRRLVAART